MTRAARFSALLALGCVLAVVGASAQDEAPADSISVPPENRVTEHPPPRPPVGDVLARAPMLFEAIVRDDPELARDFFFPRRPFSVLKGIADPDRYWLVLWRHYEQDIHALHGELNEVSSESYDRFELSRRGGWVQRREEANALPYWAARHSWIYYRVDGRERRFEVRTLINWGPRWYITHLR